jgi:hypothetical protein
MELKDADRMMVLSHMVDAGISSKRLLGATVNLILDGKITHIESITQVLYVMARLRYQPGADELDEGFMGIVAKMYVDEPGRLSLGVSNKLLWSLYAIGYKNTPLLEKISDTLVFSHTNLEMTDVVSAMKAFAYFDYLNLPARDSMVKQAIRNSQQYDFKSLASVCESLRILGYENKTLLNVVRRLLLTFEDKGELSHLVKTTDKSQGSIARHTGALKTNYCEPLQCC